MLRDRILTHGPADFYRHCSSLDPDVVDRLLRPRTSRHSRRSCRRPARRVIPLGEFFVPASEEVFPLGAKIASHLRKTFPPEGILLPEDRHFFSPRGKPSTELAYLFPPGGNT